MSKNSKKTPGTKSKTLISVKNLRVHFHLKDQIVKAVDDLSFDIRQGETLAIVGESGSGKSVTALSLMRLSDYSGGKIVSGEINLHSESGNVLDLSKLEQHSMREIRGNEISMIFQEPMTALNPVFTIGMQISESIIKHQKKIKKRSARNSAKNVRVGPDARAGKEARTISPPALRRHAAKSYDCYGSQL
jgi:glutathione transport system ATP-binding protein